MADRLEADTAPSHVVSSSHKKCNFFQVNVENNTIPDSESCKPGWTLARDMLDDYNKTQGHR